MSFGIQKAYLVSLKTLILTESGPTIGFGHVVRCASLCQAFEAEAIKPIFIIKGKKPHLDSLKNLNIVEFDWISESESLYDHLDEARVVIVDSYSSDIQLCEEIASRAAVTVFIDDENRIPYSKGIVLNGSIFAENISYEKRDNILYLLGSEYCPIRKEFWQIEDKIIHEDVENILITLGGGDIKEILLPLLNLLIKTEKRYSIQVIVSEFTPEINDPEIQSYSDLYLIRSPSTQTVVDVMLDADIAISSGGQTLYELARVGLPTLAIGTAKNQSNNLNGWENIGFINILGWWGEEQVLKNLELSLASISSQKKREKISRLGRSEIDGMGAVRVVKEILNTVS